MSRNPEQPFGAGTNREKVFNYLNKNLEKWFTVQQIAEGVALEVRTVNPMLYQMKPVIDKTGGFRLETEKARRLDDFSHLNGKIALWRLMRTADGRPEADGAARPQYSPPEGSRNKSDLLYNQLKNKSGQWVSASELREKLNVNQNTLAVHLSGLCKKLDDTAEEVSTLRSGHGRTEPHYALKERGAPNPEPPL